MDGSKLPLFVIFKGKTDGKISKSLKEITPPNIARGVLEKAWMDASMMQLWYNEVWVPYFCDVECESEFLLDDHVCHKSESLNELLQESKTVRIMVPPNFTSIVQPCDVGINKQLRDRLKKVANNWQQAQHEKLTPGDRMPTSKGADILEWLGKIWREFPNEILKNSFLGSGYEYQSDVDYSSATEYNRD